MNYLKGRPLVVAYGMGRDSTAMLVNLKRLCIRPDAILFADVGAEKEATYAYLPIMQAWLKKIGFPPVTIVKYVGKSVPYTTIEGNMVMNATLVGAAFDVGSCTVKWKIDPQIAWGNNWPLAKATWAKGKKVVKLIGYEADEEYRLKRYDAKAHAGAGQKEKDLYEPHYPLMEWGWTLKRCIDEIASEGLPVPMKSSCFFCPNQKDDEIRALSPDNLARLIRYELRAEPYNTRVKGGLRNRTFTEFILKEGLKFTPLDELEARESMGLNPNAKKFKRGYTFNPPHNQITLRMVLKEAGIEVPTSIACEGCGCQPSEDEAHALLIDCL